jgi:alpha-1,2-mannosyltransferase
MDRMVEALRSGAWVTRERMRLVALAVLVASAAAIVYVLATSDGLNDFMGRPLGTDFANIYAAGTYVREGRPDAPFDIVLQGAREQALFGATTPIYGWHYPPFFLFIAGALAAMPYPLALAVWQATTLALYLLALRAILTGSTGTQERPIGHDRLWLLLAVAFPAVFVNLGHGHNGFLTAALFAGALTVLDRRPVLAGILFGCLAYKPQFGPMVPVILAATGRWRTVTAATITVAALTVATIIVFGIDAWRAFFASVPFMRIVVLEQGDIGWHKIQSVFSWVRMWGGPIPLAYALQGGVAIALAAALVWLWRGPSAFAPKGAALCLAAVLATPYSLDYDMVVLAPAIAFLAADGLARGFDAYEKSALAALWVVPMIARSAANAVLFPIGVIVMLIVLALVLQRSARERGTNAPWLSPRRALR